MMKISMLVKKVAFPTVVLLTLTLQALSVQAAPSGFATEILADNPIGYWRLNEALGASTAVDSSGQGNNGAYSTGGITLGQPGLSGGDTAVLFDGLGSGRVVIPNSATLNPRNITMEGKVSWSGPNGLLQRILEKSFFTNGAEPEYSLSINEDGHVQVELRAGGGRSEVISTATVAQNVETHLAATYDGQMIRIYINGVLNTEQAAKPSGDIQEARFSSLGIGNQVERDRPFNGLIDEVALYGAALSADRIQAHFQAQFRKTAGLQYAVKFVCGKSDGKVVAQGIYLTAINVHNPTNTAVSFRKKFAIALPNEKPGPVSQFFGTNLGPDQALEIDCQDIFRHTQSTADFLKGFAVIESNVELDVVTVYTAAGATGQVETLHTERVPLRRQEAPKGLSDLVPVPDPRPGVGFCKRDGQGRLVVTVQNQGTADAPSSTTTVEFSPSGSFPLPTPPITMGGSVDLPPLNIPGGCFNPDCDFRITVDSNNQVNESNEGNNKASGICLG